ncbi:caspase a-like [Scomber scombrus]|uniref:caspase a-like n=1 Tax=Scomber scombrus TaxID=13677 RepID=UPI002DDA1E73|nr:caspase a-like [Scomber scombrus]
MRKADLLNLLEDLTDDQFEKFKWHLEREKLGDIEPIKKSQLEKAERRDVVDLMVQKYEPAGAVEVMKSVLKNINRNDLVKKLSNISSRSEGAVGSGTDRSINPNTDVSDGGSKPEQPAEAAVALKEQKWSNTLIPTTETFWKKKQNDDVYAATKKSIQKRVALLITNIEFEKMENRSGAEKDEQDMETLLTALNYEVVRKRNRTGQEIEEDVKEFSNHKNLKDTDSVFVVIMSHGDQNTVHGVNINGNQQDTEQKFPIKNIFTHLNTVNCPKLRNKPKIIIIQACSGDEKGSVFVTDQATAAVVSDNTQEPYLSLFYGEEDIQADFLRHAHKEKHFICFRSSTPGTVSYRSSVTGSVFIQCIVEILNTFAHKDHIEKLFRKVMQRFEKFSVWTKKRGEDTQMPTKDRVSLFKEFYLFPGL